ncbi:MAG: superfamily II helicase, partial [Harvfovirus sp.]
MRLKRNVNSGRTVSVQNELSSAQAVMGLEIVSCASDDEFVLDPIDSKIRPVERNDVENESQEANNESDLSRTPKAGRKIVAPAKKIKGQRFSEKNPKKHKVETYVEFFTNEITKQKMVDQAYDYIKLRPNLHVFSYENPLMDKNTDKKVYNKKNQLCTWRRFFVTTLSNIYNKVKCSNESMYEHYTKDERIKLFVDLDFKYKDERNISNIEQIENTILTKTIELINYRVQKFNSEIKPKLLIKRSTRSNKISFHLIWVNIVFNNVGEIIHFLTGSNAELMIAKEIQEIVKNDATAPIGLIDNAAYTAYNLRLLHCSKLEIDNKAKFYKGINYDVIDDEQIFLDSLLTNIPSLHTIITCAPPIEKPREQPTKSKFKNVTHSDLKYAEPFEIERRLVILSGNRSIDRALWFDVITGIYNANPTE